MYYYIEFRMIETAAPYYLRGTAWTSYFDRANKFETLQEAEIALARARAFLPVRRGKKCVIVHKEKE